MIKIIELLDGTILTLSKPVLFDCLSKYSFLLSNKRIFRGRNYKLGKHSTDENTAIELSSETPECSGNLVWTGNTIAEDYCKKVPIFDCNSWVDGRYNNISFKCEVSNNQCIASSIGCTCLSANNVGDWCKGGGNRFISSRVAPCKDPNGGNVQTLSTQKNGQGCYSNNDCKSHGMYGKCEYVVDNIALPGLDHIKIPCYLPDRGNCKQCRGEHKYCYCQMKSGVCFPPPTPPPTPHPTASPTAFSSLRF